LQVDFKHILLHRGYLIHWALFLLKDTKSGLESYLNLVFNNEYFTLIETSFNNLLKYLIVLTIISKSKSHINKLKQTLEGLNYEDPFVRLFQNIFIDFDMENSFAQVNECAKIIKNDYFLCQYEELFLAKSREILLQNYINLNSSIDIKSFSGLLGMDAAKTQSYLTEFFKINYPEAVLNFQNDSLQYLLPNSDSDNYVRKILLIFLINLLIPFL
jgi:hypothetical protein